MEPLTGIDDISAIIDKGQINFDFFGQSLTVSPISAGLSVLIAIPLINFVTGILQTRLTKILNKGTAIGEASAGNSMKIMEWTMPLLIVYTAFTFQAALGLYWIFQAVFGIAQMLVLAKVMPLPKVTEEDIKAAEAKYGGAAPKKKKKKPIQYDEDGNAILPPLELEDSIPIEVEAHDVEPEDDTDEKKHTGTVVKNIYAKTGKKYKVKKK
ncbi:hypothetical protein FACS1894105_13460 [Clostridia bacterium]|nr:hypothetical protein FACS1894105_13460 [Clostridia bacterium]